jgi:hypothetical protein
MTAPAKTPRRNAAKSPQVLGTFPASGLTLRQVDGQEFIVAKGSGFGKAPPKPAAPPNPGSDPRGERDYSPIKREPPQPDNSAKPFRIVGGSPKPKPR